MCESFLFIILKIQLILIIQIFKSYYISLLGLCFLIFLVNVKIFILNRTNKECLTLINFVRFFLLILKLMIIMKIFLLLGCCSITLKIDKYCSWSWKETFWWSWVFLSVCVVFSLCILLILASRFI